MSTGDFFKAAKFLAAGTGLPTDTDLLAALTGLADEEKSIKAFKVRTSKKHVVRDDDDMVSESDPVPADWSLAPPPFIERSTGWRQTTMAWLEERFPAYLAGSRRTAPARERLEGALITMSYKQAPRDHEIASRKSGAMLTTEDPDRARKRLVAGWDQDDHEALVAWLAAGGYTAELAKLKGVKTKPMPAWPFSPDSDPGMSDKDDPDDLVSSKTLEQLIEEDPDKYRKSFEATPVVLEPLTVEEELAALEDELANPAAGSW